MRIVVPASILLIYSRLSSAWVSAPSLKHAAPALPALNPLLSEIQPSKTVEIFSQVKQMQAEGIEVTSLCVGEPDFLPPQAVRDAIVASVQAGDTRYTAVTGTLPLRKAIRDDLLARKSLDYDVGHIIVANGAKQAVYQGILATVGLGGKVLVPAPYWPSYPEMVRLVGATPVICESKASTGFLLTAAELRAALEDNPETKLLILCNPSNPTGGVYQADHLKELCEVLLDFPDVIVLADEIYERLTYTAAGECPSVASILPDMFDRTLTVNGFSKAYAMTGLRLGYLAAPTPELARAVTTIQSQLTSCAGSLSQAAGLAALTQVEESELAANVAALQEKRDYVLGELDSMDGVRVDVPPQGAFYVLPDFGEYYNGDDVQMCLDLLQDQRLALVPGSSFGAPGTIRISYATSMEELTTAMAKLRAFLEAAPRKS